MTTVLRILLLAVLALPAAGAGARPVKCVDDSGRVRYIDSAMRDSRNCRIVQGQGNVASATTSRRSPVGEAQKRLAEARKALAEQDRRLRQKESNRVRITQLRPYRDAVAQAQAKLSEARREERWDRDRQRKAP